ncbi:MAG: F0F1 ATP synthase subunit A [Candidatus Sumerlaeota bacterium]|nr:F0F1 ATP synthase subunit A [Candidatus Sumerlaeota bacterium]
MADTHSTVFTAAAAPAAGAEHSAAPAEHSAGHNAAEAAQQGGAKEGGPTGEHAAAGHGESSGHRIEHIEEVPNALILFRNTYFSVGDKNFEFVRTIEPTFFTLIAVITAIIIVRLGTRRMMLIPGKVQNIIEMAVEGFHNFLTGVMGSEEHARRHLPFIGSMFFFIFFNNIMGIIPFMKAPTSAYQTTFALGIITFCYVQYHAIRMNGPLGYIYHLMGSPKGVIMWVFAPFLLVLELLGEVIKPFSLSLRLFGNIMGEDILLYVFSFLGVSLFFWACPLQFPFLFLALLTSVIQALVFTLLATIYITLFIPHEHAAQHGAEGGEHH